MKHAFACLALVAACTELPPDESTITAAASGNCTNGDCGMNTSLVKGTYFSDIHFIGEKNAAGMVVSGFVGVPGGGRLAITEKRRLIALDAADNVIAQFQGLKNKGFLLVLDNVTYKVWISEVHEEFHWWAADEPNTRIETYTFVYTPLTAPTGTPPTDICPSTRHLGNTVKSDAVVFRGPLYRAETKEIYVPDTNGWLNIACRGSAPFKSFFMRHTWASSKPLSVETSLLEQKALLDAWTANYCGDGHSFTFPNHPLRLRDKNDWIPHTSAWSWDVELGEEEDEDDADLESYEAIWDGNGAVCLNEPRTFGKDALKNKLIYDEIVKHCGNQIPSRTLSPCTVDGKYPEDWKTRGHILTANPIPPPSFGP